MHDDITRLFLGWTAFENGWAPKMENAQIEPCKSFKRSEHNLWDTIYLKQIKF